jgi:multidrug efflux pump subunit AcrA (membrane-fusion protein)
MSGQVVVVTPENRIEMRKVELGLQSENKVEVRSGLRENEIVVTGNRANLRSGQQVRPKASS